MNDGDRVVAAVHKAIAELDAGESIGAVDPAARQRFVAAMRRKAARERPVMADRRVQARSSDPCPCCGIPGWRGCDHFLPLPPRAVEKAGGYQSRPPMRKWQRRSQG